VFVGGRVLMRVAVGVRVIVVMLVCMMRIVPMSVVGGVRMSVVAGRGVGGVTIHENLDARGRRPVPFDRADAQRKAGQAERTERVLERAGVDAEADECPEQHVAAGTTHLFEVEMAHQRPRSAALPRAMSPAA
jgi:hypothetical protein